MASHPLESADVREDRVDSDGDEGQANKELSLEDLARLLNAQTLTEGEDSEITQIRVFIFSELAEAAESRFNNHGIVEDIDEAIEYRSQVLSLTPDDHEEKPDRSGSLASTFLSRYMRVGYLSDLDKAVEHFTQAQLLTPDGHADKLTWLNNLAVVYNYRFGRLGELEDLSKAIEYLTRATLLTPDGHPDKPSRLNNLGIACQSRFNQLGEASDLNKAIEYKTQAVQLTPDGHPNKPTWLTNLGTSYESRFKRLGELADVNKAIQYKTQALRLNPDGHPLRPTLLGNLGISYESRFGQLFELADLNQAIEYQTEAVLLTPEGHVDKPRWLNNLGNSHEYRFGRFGALEDLNKAIEYQTQTVQLTPDGHADKPNWFNNLGNSLRSRFERLGDLADLNQAIDYQTQAVLFSPDGHHQRPTRFNNLGKSYMSRFGQFGEQGDLNKAIEYYTQAVQLIPDGCADKPNWLGNLGRAYRSRFRHLGDLSDLESAQSSFQSGALATIIHPEIQTECARNWAKCSLSLGSSPQPAYERCMELIPYYIWLGTSIDQRYILLEEITGLATEAAAWAISVKSFSLALEWLEAGRSIVWNQILQLRTPFDDLTLVDPALAQELKGIASKLEAAATGQSTSSSNNASANMEEHAQDHHHLATKWEQLLEKARTLPGFHNFLRPRKANELLLSATDGPVVVLNAHSWHCDALIIFPGSDDITHLPLSTSSLEKLREAHVKLRSLVGHRGNRKGGFNRLVPAPKPEDDFKSILAACWTDIVQPVLDLLAGNHNVSFDEVPHVTWCTTGALSFLPLHAAGLYDGSQPNAPDLMISSFTPTLSALLPANTPADSLNSGVSAIGQEHTQGFCPLPSTVRELAAIRKHAKATRFQQLDGSAATVDAVLWAMDNNSWVHLACHATQNPDDPTRSAFHLHDGALTLEAITKCSFKNKGLAFLSACQTATGHEKLADESVHLAAGMLMAGYPSVIATMWSIQDEDGPVIAEAVYAELLKEREMDHRQAARALHKAVSGLRKDVGDEAFERWVPFIHIGV